MVVRPLGLGGTGESGRSSGKGKVVGDRAAPLDAEDLGLPGCNWLGLLDMVGF